MSGVQAIESHGGGSQGEQGGGRDRRHGQPAVDMPAVPPKQDGKGAASLMHAWLLFTSYRHEGQNLEGVFVSEKKALAYADQLPPLPSDAQFLVERWEMNPEAPRRAVDVTGFTEVSSVDTKGREFVDDRGVVVVVPWGVEVVGDGGA